MYDSNHLLLAVTLYLKIRKPLLMKPELKTFEFWTLKQYSVFLVVQIIELIYLDIPWSKLSIAN